MAEQPLLQRAPTDRIGRLLFRVARAFALGGGLVMVALTLMSLASIVGRAAFARPIPGDYELVQLGTAIAVAAFLPLTQLRGGHVLVDFFTARSGDLLRESLDTFGAALIGVAGSVFAWRLAVGAWSFAEANDQTTILAIPTWYAVALMVPSFALLGLCGFYTAWQHWSVRKRGSADAGAPVQ